MPAFFVAVHTAGPPRAPKYVLQVSELSWEPTERWLQLPREVRRSRRGEKSVEHLANLRRSDPLINAFAWRDLAEEQRRVEDSPFARLNQQATATAPAPCPPPPVPLPCPRLPTAPRRLLTLPLPCRRASCAGSPSTVCSRACCSSAWRRARRRRRSRCAWVGRGLGGGRGGRLGRARARVRLREPPPTSTGACA